MPKSDPVTRLTASTAKWYGLSVLTVAASLSATLLLQPFVFRTPLFFLSIMLTTWYGGIGPGLLAVLLSTLSINFFLNPRPDFAMGFHDVTFLLSALIVSSWSATRRRAEDGLRQARDELDAKVQERTADLSRSNEQLRIEIAERERAEEVLREQANLLNLTHDSVFVRDMSDVVTFWNRGAEEEYGWTSKEAVGQVSHDVTRTIFSAPLEQINEELLSTGRWEGELTHTRRDGTPVVVASRWSLQRDEQGNPVAILETNNDITERKQAEEALQKAQAELAHVARVATMGELTSSIAHEVNQPLTAIVTNGNACLRWLASEPPNLDEARESVERIIRDGHRASEVVGRVRALFRKTAPDTARLDINDLIQDVVTIVHGEIFRNKVLLRTELASDLPPVLGDRVQLQQVLVNLIINGIESMSTVTGRPRKLLIRSQRHEPGVVLVAVQDSGAGIEAQNFDQLFDAFFTTKADGMGMGLSISRTTVVAHGGRLWATANDSQGATFQFTLPTNGENV